MLLLENVFKAIRHYLRVALERAGVQISGDVERELQDILALGVEYAQRQEDRITALERRVAQLEQRPPVVS